MRQLFAWQGVPIRIIDDALKLIAIGTFISGSLGVDMKTSMLASGLIMPAYTFMGGLWAVEVIIRIGGGMIVGDSVLSNKAKASES